MGCPICGPLCSRYYMVISLWGIFMLAALGGFFYWRCPALFEDLPVDHKSKEWERNNYTFEFIKEKYEQNAMNCWVAAGAYVVLFLFSFVQYKMNNRSNYEMA